MLKKIFRGLTAAWLAFFVLCVGMTAILYQSHHYVNDFLGTKETVIKNDNITEESVHYKSNYFKNGLYNPETRAYTNEEAAKYLEDKLDFIEEVMGESITLLKNDGALPLSAEETKVTALGRASADLHYCGTSGSSMIATTYALKLDAAFSEAGLTVNPVALSFYNSRTEKSNTAASGGARIGETPVSAYPSDVTASFAQYNDAAVIFFTRPGGEGNDLTLEGGEDFSGSQLNLNQDEKDVLELAKRNFDKVIVVLNTDNPIGIGEMKDDPGINAIIWAGGFGINGVTALGKLLNNTDGMNFSGKVNDTWAIDSASSPAAQNAGYYTWTNAEEVSDYIGHTSCLTYVVNAEGIYIGYKYYETRYEDSVLGGRNADSTTGAFASENGWSYAEEMGYPFGFGMSYTTFLHTLKDVKWNDDNTAATIEVEVRNTGNYAGKDVVQIWYQSPYTDYDRTHGVEKAAIQLADYEKTSVLYPASEADETHPNSQTVTVEVDMHNCVSYDSDGSKTWILDAGTHYFALGNGAHEALNNILAAKGYTTDNGMDAEGNADMVASFEVETLDADTYSVSRWTGGAVTNLFGDADVNEWLDGQVTYLTRSDWTTFPKTYDNLTASEEMIRELACSEELTGYDYSYGKYTDAPEVIYGSHDTNYSLSMLRGKALDDPMWEGLLNQLSLRDTALIIGVGNGFTEAIDSIYKSETYDGDGPTGFSGTIVGQVYNGGKVGVKIYFSQNASCATWNKELQYRFGYFLGEDGLFLSKTSLWAPGADLHRSPFSGRNAEYVSEDGVLGFEYLAQQCKGMSDMGLIPCPKHFAFNDQENGRVGLANFFTEQYAREINLRPWEGAFTEGHAGGTMSAYPRIGLTYIGMSNSLLNGWLRGEIGFKGYVLTDMAGSSAYMRPVESVKCGVTLFDNNNLDQANILEAAAKTDTTLQKAMREAARHNLYSIVNSNAMNGFDENAQIVSVLPWWKSALIALDVCVSVVLAAFVAVYAVAAVKEKHSKG